MSKATKVVSQAKELAAKLTEEIKGAEGAWDDDFLIALVKHRYSKFLGETPRDPETAQVVADHLNVEFGLDEQDAVSLAWFEKRAHERRLALIDDSERATNDIDEAKAALEAAQEAKKAAQATIDTEHSRLRNLARELKKHFVYPLPMVPKRQRDLPLSDGEEWRAVKLAEVLSNDLLLKSVVLEKLGDITLGEYAEQQRQYGLSVSKPQKLTRKQWQNVEDVVQEWHAAQAENEGDEDKNDAETEFGDDD